MNEDVDRTIHRCIEIARDERVANQDDPDTDAAFESLFRLVEAPRPSPGFTLRAVQAARRASLPAGRHALARPWVRTARWAGALTGGVIAGYGAAVALQPVAPQAFARLVALVIQAGFWTLPFVSTTVDVWWMLTSAGRALAIALTTSEGLMVLTLAMFVGALALTALQRLLSSQKELSPW